MSARPSSGDWTTMKFDDFVENVRDQALPTPQDSRLYIGLEDMDSGSLHVKRWGTAVDLKGDKLRMKKGDLLFAKRNAYLRRVAIAPHDGFFSAHGMVLRPKSSRVWPDFLPFFLQSDVFMNRAIEISVGSLSPTINWGTLRNQEFALPPIEEQEHIAEVLWTADGTLESFQQARGLLTQAIDAYASEFLSEAWSKERLGRLLTSVQYGTSTRVGQREPNSVPVLRIPNVIGGKLVLDGVGWVNLSQTDQAKYRLDPGDVLIVRTNGNPDFVGRTAVVDSVPDNCVYASYLIRLRPDLNLLLPTYLHSALSSSLLRRTLRQEIRSSAGNYNLNTKGIGSQTLPLPPILEQQRFVAELESYNTGLEQINCHILKLTGLRRLLVNQAIGANNV